MKKILLLGGSSQQCIAIETAKKLGYFTVLCDYLKDNPGQFIANKFYLESTTNKEAVLEIARKENVDGVIAYASDPAAPTAAFVAEQLGLATNPYVSVETLCNKNLFRDFLKKNSFNVPRSHTIKNDGVDFKLIKESFAFPIIIKPVDSSGSKGVTVLDKFDEEKIKQAVSFADSFSRVHTVIVEEYIVRNHKYLVGGDIVVQDGKVVLWGLLNCHRDKRVNELVPVGKSYPLDVTSRQLEILKKTLTDLVEKLHISFGELNVELVIDDKDRCFIIDAGPRPGGNMIPELLSLIFDVNLTKANIEMAMGKKTKLNANGNPHSFYASHNLHSDKDYIFGGVTFDKELESHLMMKNIYKHIGDKIEFFDNASKAIGIIFMKFDSKLEQDAFLDNIYEHIEYKVK